MRLAFSCKINKFDTCFILCFQLNIMDLGKFMKCSQFKIVELDTRKTFPGKVFVFEKCLLYARIIGNFALSYRNHFKFNSKFAFLTNEDQLSIRITDNMQKKHDILLSSLSVEIVAEMKKLINQFYDPRRSNDSAFVDVHELMISEDDDDDEDAANGDDLERRGWVTNVAAELASANTTLSKSIWNIKVSRVDSLRCFTICAVSY